MRHRKITTFALLLSALLSAFLWGCAVEPAFVSEEPQKEETGSPAPSETPAPPVRITLSGELLSADLCLELGSDPTLSASVTSSVPLSALILTDSCDYNDNPLYPYTASVTFPVSDERLLYDLTDASTNEGCSLDAAFDFSLLTPGVHHLTLDAVTAFGEEMYEVFKVRYYVLSDEWNTIKVSDFNGSYDEALSFFQDPDRFLYRYQWVWGRYIVADPDWEKMNIVGIEGFGGRTWRIHRDAVPYFQEAIRLLNTELVRVHGTNGDTGLVPLCDLVYTYNGSYVSRFTSSLKTISHHAFGAAVDLNAKMEPNLNNKQNRNYVDSEVRDLLSYNGIQTENGLSYYDYTYFGNCQTTENGVPESIANYLLYELAFYRAGFDWGHYYVSTSDAMHFTLSDEVRIKHDDARGLRKVFDYTPTPNPNTALSAG